MTEAPIRYAKTSDGVSIAYCVFGSGSPALVVCPDILWSHVQIEQSPPYVRRWHELTARSTTVIKYDGRGTGLSGREAPAYSVDARAADLEAVLGGLGDERVALWAGVSNSASAVLYAVRHPDRVSHLVLWCPYASADGYWGHPEVQGLIHLAATDWETFVENVARARGVGWQAEDLAKVEAEFTRRCTTQAVAIPTLASIQEIELAPALPKVQVPTLVMHRRDLRAPPLAAGIRVASLVPNSELVIFDGSYAMPMDSDAERMASAVLSHIGVVPRGPSISTPAPVTTILFTDVEGSTGLTDRLGDAAARELLRAHERITREALKAHGGSEIKTMGDGFMASFGSATKALECAIAIQKAFAEPGTAVGAEQLREDVPVPGDEGAVAQPLRPGHGIKVRIGLNAGEPIAEDDDLFGTAVIVAARIAAKAEGGEILVSDVVRQLVAGKGFLFNDRGEHALKGFEDPVRVWEVRWSL